MPPRPIVAVLLAVVTLALAGAGLQLRRDGTGAPDARVLLAIGLSRQQDELAAYALSVNDPTHPAYGRFLDPAAVAERFGATPATRDAVLDDLRSRGIAAEVEATGGVVLAEADAAQAEDLLRVDLVETVTGDGTRFVGTTTAPTLPAAVRRQVDGIATVSATVAGDDGPTETSAAVQPCPDETRLRLATVHEELRLGPLHDAGVRGAGMRVGVLADERTSRRAQAAWTTCLGRPEPVTDVRRVGRVPVAATDEESLDTARVLAAAPALDRLLLVEADPLLSPVHAFAEVLRPQADGRAGVDTVSTSLGYCEQDLGEGDVRLTEWLLAGAAATGTTVVAASGDDGATACAPDRRAAVQYPASSPFVTAVGGTQVGADGTPVVWDDRPAAVRAGGGGASARFPRPGYQQAVTGSGTDGRLVPDVAAAARPADAPAIPSCSAERCTWRQVGGTSAAAPTVAAALTLVKHQVRAAGAVAPGLFNPVLYAMGARGADGLPAFTDVVEGDNALGATDCCAATAGFDPASGWGVPRVDRIADLLVAAW